MFHALHFIIKNVRLQQLMIALYPPPEVGGFTATEDKKGWVNNLVFFYGPMVI
jgi:hypothetical protein